MDRKEKKSVCCDGFSENDHIDIHSWVDGLQLIELFKDALGCSWVGGNVSLEIGFEVSLDPCHS